MGIAAKLVIAQTLDMSKHAEKLLPDAVLAEMRRDRIGYRLMLFRKAVCDTQADMARLVGTSAVNWNRYEKGERALPEVISAVLKSRYGFSTDYYLLNDWSKLAPDMVEKIRDVEDGLGGNAESESR